MTTREERDSLGSIEVAAEALWGAQTQRALANFAVDGPKLRDVPELIVALCHVKAAAARANREVGAIPAEVAEAIVAVARVVASGAHHDQFPLPVVQGGGGTSTNMNANEVLANLAEEALGGTRGSYSLVRPHDHVNRSQPGSTCFARALHPVRLARPLPAWVQALPKSGRGLYPGGALRARNVSPRQPACETRSAHALTTRTGAPRTRKTVDPGLSRPTT